MKQTAGLIKSKAKKGEMWAIKKINETIKIEINEGKVKRIDLHDFKKIAEVRPTNFGRINLAFNPDSTSTKVRLIHDFTAAVLGTTLSLEILTLDNTLGNMAEAALSFRLHYFVRSYDIRSCYTQFSLEGDFIWYILNVWFDDIENQKRPYILLRHAMPFGFAAAPGIVEMAIFKFVYANVENEELKVILDI